MTNKFIEQRVEALENELSELKLIVAQIRKPSIVVEEALANDVIEFEGKQYKKVDREAREGDVVIFRKNTSWVSSINKPYKVFVNYAKPRFIGDIDNDYMVYDNCFNRDRETVDVYELIVEDKPKTANQLRAEIIEKAKGFIEESKVELTLNRGRGYVIHPGWICDLKFEVNEEKRTVVAILSWKPNHYKKSDVKARGIAKCDPSDVFNEHIGKAIALGRALGLDVSEFEQAVQPTLAVGQVVTRKGGKENRIITHKNPHFTDAWCKDNKLWNYGHELNIINDTNAIYSEVTK